MQERRYALVTGASSGLGREFARSLARRKIHLVLVGRRKEPMLKLAEELRSLHEIDVRVEQLDLSQAGQARELQQRLDRDGITPDILINNAAFGLSGEFLTQDIGQLREMLQVDIISLVELTHLFGSRMVGRGNGSILLVASLAAFQPTPLMAAYGAAKHFVLAFGEALHVELGPKVGVTVLSPGLMETEFFAVAGFQPKASLRRSMVAPSTVAERGLQAMFALRSGVIVGKLNWLAAFLNRFTSRHMQAKLAYRMAKD